MIESYKREALTRLRTVQGHLGAVVSMVDEERYCPELMKQVAALQGSTGRPPQPRLVPPVRSSNQSPPERHHPHHCLLPLTEEKTTDGYPTDGYRGAERPRHLLRALQVQGYHREKPGRHARGRRGHQGRAGHLRPDRHRPGCPAGNAGRPRLPHHLRPVTMHCVHPPAPRRGPGRQAAHGC